MTVRFSPPIYPLHTCLTTDVETVASVTSIWLPNDYLVSKHDRRAEPARLAQPLYASGCADSDGRQFEPRLQH